MKGKQKEWMLVLYNTILTHIIIENPSILMADGLMKVGYSVECICGMQHSVAAAVSQTPSFFDRLKFFITFIFRSIRSMPRHQLSRLLCGKCVTKSSVYTDTFAVLVENRRVVTVVRVEVG